MSTFTTPSPAPVGQPVTAPPLAGPAGNGPGGDQRRVRKTAARRDAVRRVVRHAFLATLGVLMILPFLWMVLASFKTRSEVENVNPFPQTGWQTENYGTVLGLNPLPKNDPAEPDKYVPINFGRWYFNSLFVAAWVTLLQCVTSAMAAYAFARLRWPGRDRVFLLYLATMMIPGVVTMIPNFQLMVKLGLYNNYWGLILPGAFSTFGTFLLRQFMLGIPASLDESASIDGASLSRTFWDIILPLSRPGLITLAIFTFMGNFGSFQWPYLIIKDEHLKTLPTGMLFFNGLYDKQTNLMMAGTVMNIVPLIVLFVVLQKYLVKGIQLGAVKG